VRVVGTNLGQTPVLYTGDWLVAGAPPPPVGTPCAGTEGTATCFEFPTPPGEGSGHQLAGGVNGSYATSGGFYPFSLVAGGQAAAMWSAAYAAPVVTGVVSATGQFPTRGGVGITLVGTNFGVTPAARPASPVAVSFFAFPGDPGTVNATGCVRVSQTAITCTLPPGSGAGLSVSVTVADETGVTPSLLSYDAPNVTSVSVVSMGPWDGVMPGMAMGATTGGSVVTLTGSNFGPWPTWVPLPSAGTTVGGASVWGGVGGSGGGGGNGTAGGAGGGANATSGGGAMSPYNGGVAGQGAVGYCVFLSWTYRGTSAPAPR